MAKRECGECTKCCEGFLEGDALGHSFGNGKPCYFVEIGKGCTIYPDRPEHPCKSFKCNWLTDLNYPEWLKPYESNSIFMTSEINGIPFLNLIEAGNELNSKVLSWAIKYAISNQKNFFWTVNGEINWIGSIDFNNAILSTKITS